MGNKIEVISEGKLEDIEYVVLAYSKEVKVLEQMAKGMVKELNLKIEMTGYDVKTELFSLILCYRNNVYFSKK